MARRPSRRPLARHAAPGPVGRDGSLVVGVGARALRGGRGDRVSLVVPHPPETQAQPRPESEHRRVVDAQAQRAGDDAQRVGVELQLARDETQRVGGETQRAGDEAQRAGDES